MLRWTLLFLAVASLAGLLGFTGWAGTAASAAQTLCYLLLGVLLVFVLVRVILGNQSHFH